MDITALIFSILGITTWLLATIHIALIAVPISFIILAIVLALLWKSQNPNQNESKAAVWALRITLIHLLAGLLIILTITLLPQGNDKGPKPRMMDEPIQKSMTPTHPKKKKSN